MKKSPNVGAPFVALVFVALLAAPLVAAEYAHPRLRSGEKLIHSVALLRPAVSYEKSGVLGSESNLKIENGLEEEIQAALVRALEANGFQVRSFANEQATGDSRQAIGSLQLLFDQGTVQLNKHAKDVRNGRYSIGERVSESTITQGTDAVVFVRARAVEATKGNRFMHGGLLGMALLGGVQVTARVSLVDSSNGDVLFYGAIGPVPNTKIAKPLNSLVGKIPLPRSKQ